MGIDSMGHYPESLIEPYWNNLYLNVGTIHEE